MCILYKQEERERECECGKRVCWREGVQESVCVHVLRRGERERVKCVCTLRLASMHIPDNALHIHVHVSLTGTIIQLH